MKLLKAFGTANMPKELFNWLWMNESIRRDGFQAYTVGQYIGEYEAASQEDKEEYGQHDIDTARKVDAWLIADGATAGELILIAHGETY